MKTKKPLPEFNADSARKFYNENVELRNRAKEYAIANNKQAKQLLELKRLKEDIKRLDSVQGYIKEIDRLSEELAAVKGRLNVANQIIKDDNKKLKGVAIKHYKANAEYIIKELKKANEISSETDFIELIKDYNITPDNNNLYRLKDFGLKPICVNLTPNEIISKSLARAIVLNGDDELTTEELKDKYKNHFPPEAGCEFIVELQKEITKII